MNMIRHIFQQPFIAATGAAALLHSTWSLATLFAGEQPESMLHLAGWLIPALLIAFALDVGQISTSAQIRESGLTFARAVTFFVFAVATWYLQFLYIVHHMPALELSAGISDAHRQAALVLRDFAMWLIPALLPISTVLYTFSGDNSQQNEQNFAQPDITITDAPDSDSHAPDRESETLETLNMPDRPLLLADLQQKPTNHEPDTESGYQSLHQIYGGEYRSECECGWMSSVKDDATSAQRALAGHKARCTHGKEPVLNGADGGHVDSE